MTKYWSALVTALTLLTAIPGAHAEMGRFNGRSAVTPQIYRAPGLRTIQPQHLQQRTFTGTPNKIESRRTSRTGIQKNEVTTRSGTATRKLSRDGVTTTKVGNEKTTTPLTS